MVIAFIILNVQKSYRDQLYAVGVETSKSLPTKFGIPKPKEFVSCMYAQIKKQPFREKGHKEMITRKLSLMNVLFSHYPLSLGSQTATHFLLNQ
jgi:hypothetical protein